MREKTKPPPTGAILAGIVLALLVGFLIIPNLPFDAPAEKEEEQEILGTSTREQMPATKNAPTATNPEPLDTYQK